MADYIEGPQKTDAGKLKKEVNRREFLRSGLLTIAAGAIAATGTYEGIGYIGKNLGEILVDADKEVKKMALDIKSLYGSLERKMADETRQLKDSYASGRLKIYEELGIASPQELSELEGIIQTNEAFEKEYGLVQRLAIFKDRINTRLAGIDSSTEEIQPGFLQRINDSSRKLFGMKAGEEGKYERDMKRKRLYDLCQVYDTNEDNRTAEVEVLKKVNGYLAMSNLSKEERVFYESLKEEQKRSGEGDLRKFITEYETNGGRKQVLENLRSSIETSEEVFGKIQENKIYISNLQELLKEGIDLGKQIREQKSTEFAVYEQRIQSKVTELRGSVDRIINELEDKGYLISTRQEEIDRGTFIGPYARKFGEAIVPIQKIGAVIAGGLAAIVALRTTNRGKKLRVCEKALNTAVDMNNQAVDAYDSATKPENLKP